MTETGKEEFNFDETPQMTDEEFFAQSDFSLEDEYKEEPLVRPANYKGHTIAVSIDTKSNAILWQVCLEGNGGVMSDGETSVDGSHHFYRNWLPKKGDDTEMTKDGRNTKRQAKINMLKRFADGMKVDMENPNKILEAIAEGKWVSIPVVVSIELNEYLGIVRNQINKMVRGVEAESSDDIPF